MDIQTLHRQYGESKRASPQAREAASTLSWAGRSLLGLFLIAVVSAAWPVQLLQPSWLQKISQQLIQSGTTALLGAVFIILAPLLDKSQDSLFSQSKLVRSLSVWVTFGFALLIPLQGYTGIKLLNAEKAKQLQELRKVDEVVKAIRASTTREELQNALLRLPISNAPRLPAELPASLEQVRDRLAENLEPRIKKAQNTLEESRSKRWQKWLEYWFKNALSSLLFFLAFSAIAKRTDYGPTLISQMFNFRLRGFQHQPSSSGKRRGGRKSKPKKTVDKEGVISTAWIDEDQPKS